MFFLGTPYDVVFQDFLEKITTLEFLTFSDDQNDTIIKGLLKRSCISFMHYSYEDLSRDDSKDCFVNNLSEEVIDIITDGMVIQWLKPMVYNSENMKNFLDTKDYSLAASPANLIDKILSVYENTSSEYNNKVYEYTYNNGDIGSLYM